MLIDQLPEWFLIQVINSIGFPYRSQALSSLRLCNQQLYNLVNSTITEAKLKKRNLYKGSINYFPSSFQFNQSLKDIVYSSKLCKQIQNQLCKLEITIGDDSNSYPPEKITISKEQRLQRKKDYNVTVKNLESLKLICWDNYQKFLLPILKSFSSIETPLLEEFCLVGLKQDLTPQMLDHVFYIIQKNKVRKFETDLYIFEECQNFEFDKQSLRQILSHQISQDIPIQNPAFQQSLRSLTLKRNFKVSNMEFLQNLNLVSFALVDSIQFTDVELRQMIDVIRNLKSLTLRNCRLVTTQFFNDVGPLLKLTKLEILDVRIYLNWNQFSDLHHLNITANTVNFTDMLSNFQIIQNLQHLELYRIPKSFDQVLSNSISKLTQLTQLMYISENEIDANLLQQIGQLPRLVNLDVKNAIALEVLVEGLVARNIIVHLSLQFFVYRSIFSDQYDIDQFYDNKPLIQSCQLLTKLSSLEELSILDIPISFDLYQQLVELPNLRYIDAQLRH
eukprot:TRINITY_DN8853_c0_g2_i4.p1 TRINITY_DN8853_c0_g2~~TRINITY_DN8853_c0_g2_i4.p1  ORF type:complete len:504 (-),score=7.69 TRINITY_DN8853_c0_g2_i4:173-1684(-)